MSPFPSLPRLGVPQESPPCDAWVVPIDVVPGQPGWADEFARLNDPAVGATRTAVVTDLLARIRAVRPGERALVAVDGVDGAGKSHLASELVALASECAGRPVVNVSIDGFHRSRAERMAAEVAPRGSTTVPTATTRSASWWWIASGPGGRSCLPCGTSSRTPRSNPPSSPALRRGRRRRRHLPEPPGVGRALGRLGLARCALRRLRASRERALPRARPRPGRRSQPPLRRWPAPVPRRGRPCGRRDVDPRQHRPRAPCPHVTVRAPQCCRRLERHLILFL